MHTKPRLNGIWRIENHRHCRRRHYHVYHKESHLWIYAISIIFHLDLMFSFHIIPNSQY